MGFMPACGRMAWASSPALVRGGVIRAWGSCEPAAGRAERGTPAHPCRHGVLHRAGRGADRRRPRPVPDRRAAPQAAEPAPDRAGFVLVLLGLTLFLIGLEEALFPIGETMARQLTAPESIGAERLADGVDWHDYLLVYAFAAAIGFATTVAEPSLIAVALKAEEVSGGAVRAWGSEDRGGGRRRAGRGAGMLPHRHGHAPAVVHRRRLRRGESSRPFRSSRAIVPLAYDSGGVTTSTVTVPVVAALGLGPRRHRARGAAR